MSGKVRQLAPEVLRRERVRNYRVKSAQHFTCAQQGCETHTHLLVAPEGKTFAAYCPTHLGDREPTPGQWNEALGESTGGDEAA
jgi:hypothetical protein